MTTAEQLLALAVVVCPVLCCVPLARRRRPGRVAVGFAAVTAVLAVVWDRHRAAYEGPAIVTLTATHGLTVVDLVVPVALAVAVAVVWRHRQD